MVNGVIDGGEDGNTTENSRGRFRAQNEQRRGGEGRNEGGERELENVKSVEGLKNVKNVDGVGERMVSVDVVFN